MPLLILGDRKKGLPSWLGINSIQTLSSFCQRVSGPSTRRASRMTVAKGGAAPGVGNAGRAALVPEGAADGAEAAAAANPAAGPLAAGPPVPPAVGVAGATAVGSTAGRVATSGDLMGLSSAVGSTLQPAKQAAPNRTAERGFRCMGLLTGVPSCFALRYGPFRWPDGLKGRRDGGTADVEKSTTHCAPKPPMLLPRGHRAAPAVVRSSTPSQLGGAAPVPR